MTFFSAPPPLLSSKRRRGALNNPLSPYRGDPSRRSLYSCSYCGRDTSYSVRVKCAECPDYDSCVPCFAVGAALHPHSPGHAYRVIDDLSFPLYDPAWGADEELLLLEAISAHGVGAWRAVADHVGAKDAASCQAHWEAVYAASPCFPEPSPLPSMIGVAGGGGSSAADRAARRGAAAAASAARAAAATAAGGGGGGAPTSSSGDSHGRGVGKEGAKRRTPPPPMVPRRTPPPPSAGGGARGVPGSPGGANASPLASPGGVGGGPAAAGADPTGFHARRYEHDPEFDNDAELLISEIEFRDTDTPGETAEKLKAVAIYNARLDAREARRAFVASSGLTDGRRLHSDDRRTPLAERDLAARLRALARFLAPRDAAALAAGALHEARAARAHRGTQGSEAGGGAHPGGCRPGVRPAAASWGGGWWRWGWGGAWQCRPAAPRQWRHVAPAQRRWRRRRAGGCTLGGWSPTVCVGRGCHAGRAGAC